MMIVMAEAIDVSGGILRVVQKFSDFGWRDMSPSLQRAIRDDLPGALFAEAERRDLTIVSTPMITVHHYEEGIID